MKKEFNLITLLAALLFTTTVFGQNSFGLKAGLGLSSFRATDDFGSLTEDQVPKQTFHAGFILDLEISDFFGIETGLQMSNKGAAFKEENLGIGIDNFINFYYVDLPVLFKVGYKFGNNRVYGALGPYVGVGIMGKNKIVATVLGQEESETDDIVFGKDPVEHDFKRVDGGLDMRVGIELGVLQLSLYNQLGLANIAVEDFNNLIIKNRGLGFSVGVFLNKKYD